MAATPANSQASEEAAKNGKPFHICISTTPGDLTTEHGIYAKALFDNSATFMEIMYDWDMDTVRNYIRKKSKNNFLYIEFSYKELGRDEEWFKKQCRELNMDLFKIKREILLQWNKSSDLSPFSEKQMIRLMDNAKDPITRLMINDVHPVNIYDSEFDWRSTLLIGVDVASGMSRDSTAVTVWDPYTEQIVADFHDNQIDGFELQEFLVELVGTFFKNAVIIIERNNSGIQLIDFLLRTPIARNLFYENREVKAEKKTDSRKIQKSQTRHTRIYGINTDTKTRPLMMDILRDIVQNEYDRVNSREIIDEIAGLQRTKNDKIEHAENGHDDLVMSMLIARYVWAYGKNLGNWMISRPAIQSGTARSVDDVEEQFSRQLETINSFNKSHLEDPRNINYSGNQLAQEWRIREQMNRRHPDAEIRQKVRQDTDDRSRAMRSIFNMNKR